jgi:hypothetical protein
MRTPCEGYAVMRCVQDVLNQRILQYRKSNPFVQTQTQLKTRSSGFSNQLWFPLPAVPGRRGIGLGSRRAPRHPKE